jgi:hypothetical protein
MAKVIVWVPVKFSVPYRVEVQQLDVEHVKEALRQKFPEEWAFDPDLYEKLGSEYMHAVEELTEADIKADGTGRIEIEETRQ